MRRLFIVGSQGIPASYGGLETFAHELAVRLVQRGYPVTVSCEIARGAQHGPSQFEGVDLFYVEAPQGNMRTLVSDRRAILEAAERGRAGDVIYLLGSAAGPFVWDALRAARRRGLEFWLNPDGLEWLRPRWPWYARKFLRFSESFLLPRSDVVVCDAAAIRDHHASVYGIPQDRMEVIEYGAPIVTEPDPEAIESRQRFLDDHGLTLGEYYTYVGRFVPDNNMELMVRGVVASPVDRKLLVCASYDEADPFYQTLKRIADESPNGGRVIFAGGVYDRPLLMALRLGEFAYFHGHEVGGTNPALVEAMGLGSVVVALSTPYNREVLQDSASYFEKSCDDLVRALVALEDLGEEGRRLRSEGVRQRVEEHYNWERIADLYQELLDRD